MNDNTSVSLLPSLMSCSPEDCLYSNTENVRRRTIICWFWTPPEYYIIHASRAKEILIGVLDMNSSPKF